MTQVTQLELEATHLGLRDIAGWLDQLFESSGWSGSASRGAIELAIHEIAANVVDHAAPPDGKIRIDATPGECALHIEVADKGTPFDANDHSMPGEDAPQVRGYGLMIVEQVAQTIDYCRADGRNLWTATFNIEPAPAG